MGRAVTTYRVGLPVGQLMDLWEEHGTEFSGGPQPEHPARDEEDKTATGWFRDDRKVTVKMRGDGENSSLMTLEVSADQPEEEMEQFTQRFSETLNRLDHISGASFVTEPHPEATPDGETDPDQPL